MESSLPLARRKAGAKDRREICRSMDVLGMSAPRFDTRNVWCKLVNVIFGFEDMRALQWSIQAVQRSDTNRYTRIA